MILQQEQKSTVRQKILRQHTASADKKEYFDSTIFGTNLWNQFTKLFPLISTLSLYLIANLLGKVLNKGQRLKEGGAYFKVREIDHIKF